MSEEKNVKQIILNQLKYGPACRIHLHRECCEKLGKSLEPEFNENGQRVRICKDMADSLFDKPFLELLGSGLVVQMEKGRRIEGFVFYKLTPK